jgi:hypothetical protein
VAVLRSGRGRRKLPFTRFSRFASVLAHGMPARLGYVLHWIFFALAVLWATLGFTLVVDTECYGADCLTFAVIVFGLGALILYAIGRGIRYVLAGQ